MHLYGDDEDWPYLSGDVDEEAVRLAASIIPEAKNEAAEQNIRKNRDDAEHTDDKRVIEHHKNRNGSSHRSMNLDKFDGTWSLNLWNLICATKIRQPFSRALRKCCSIIYVLLSFFQ